ncbi:MAG: 3D domain-containing protein [Oscillospiraceae bacterium]
MLQSNRVSAHQIARQLASFFCLLTALLVFCLVTTEQAKALYILTGTEDSAILLDEHADTTDFSSKLIFIGKGSNPEITLAAGQTVSLVYDGATLSMTTRSETISALLNRAQIKPAPLDMIAVDLDAPILTITVASDITFYEQMTEPVAFETVRVPNPALAKGVEQVTQTGKDGVQSCTYEVIYAGGAQVSRQLVEKGDSTALPQIVEYGTQTAAITPNDRISDITADGNGGGYLTFASGGSLRYSKVISGKATAYTAGHGGVGTRTATGTRVRRGTVAVDPKVIPLGTKLYIVAGDSVVYGTAVAEDTGGAIRGNKLDLYYDTYQECINFGRRSCTVYVLD